MDISRTATGALAAVLLGAQAVASLLWPPGETYTGTDADALNDSLFAAALVALAVHLALVTGEARERYALRAALCGCLLLSAGALATVAAGEEAWDVPFVIGFALAAGGLLTAAVVRRSFAYAAMLLGLVLALAFMASGGAFALGAATVLGLRALEPSRVPGAA
jgi:hypothetical protein